MKSFDQCISQAASKVGISAVGGLEPFGNTDYAEETSLKEAAFADFIWGMRLRNVEVEPLVASVMPRHYRTTSRRSVRFWNGRLQMQHGDRSMLYRESMLEPERHEKIYAEILFMLSKEFRAISQIVNHVVIRGTYDEHVVIFNISEVDALVIRGLRRLLTNLQKKFDEIKSAWLFIDPRGNKYYLELERPVAGQGAKKIYGAAAWTQQVAGINYQIGVFSYSQINLSMLPTMIGLVKDIVQPNEELVIQDIHCGFGLYGAALAPLCAGVIAIDPDKSSVDNARYNITRAGGKVTALAGALNSSTYTSLVKKFPPVYDIAQNAVVLGPPRTGTEPDFVKTLALTQPVRVAHLFGAPDEITRSLKEWSSAGYKAERIIPVDLFPGTTNLEVVVQFLPR